MIVKVEICAVLIVFAVSGFALAKDAFPPEWNVPKPPANPRGPYGGAVGGGGEEVP